jgi:SAM-dependent methyltransferase
MPDSAPKDRQLEPLRLPANNRAAAPRGQDIYTPFFLRHVYDPLVIRFANRFTWRCPSRLILDLYDKHASDRHLDVGPGTGWYLDRCRFPVPRPRVVLLDINSDVLDVTARRIARYHPTCVRADLFEPMELEPHQFGSVGLTHVLHCLPGHISDKAKIFDHLREMLRPGGTLFGSTILAEGVPQTRLARSQLRSMNRSGVFDNAGDSLDDLRKALGERFSTYVLETRGSIALFSAKA